jgi:hypothetical protein
MKYVQLLESLPPNELILKFTMTAPKHVQEGMKSTIIGFLGSLPNYALDASLFTTSSKVASLLYQMQITGYMFKNAENRMTMSKALKGKVFFTIFVIQQMFDQFRMKGYPVCHLLVKYVLTTRCWLLLMLISMQISQSNPQVENR